MSKRKEISPQAGNILKKPDTHGAAGRNAEDSDSSDCTLKNSSTTNLLKTLRNASANASKNDISRGSTADLLSDLRSASKSNLHSKGSTAAVFDTHFLPC